MRQGLTFVELLVIVAISAIIAIIAVKVNSCSNTDVASTYNSLIAQFENSNLPDSSAMLAKAEFKSWRSDDGKFVLRNFGIYAMKINCFSTKDEYLRIFYMPELEVEDNMIVMHSIAEQSQRKDVDGECIAFEYRGMQYAVLLLKEPYGCIQIIGSCSSTDDKSFLPKLLHYYYDCVFRVRQYMAHHEYKTNWKIGANEHIDVFRDDADHVCVKFIDEKGS